MQPGQPFLVRPRLPGGADRRWNGGHRRDAFRQRAEVKPGAADDDRPPPVRRSLVQDGRHIIEPAADRVALRRWHMTKEAMRSLGFLFDGRPRGQQTQRGIDLHRIGIDDHARAVGGTPSGEGGLAACGRAGDEEGTEHVRRTVDGRRPGPL